MTTKDIVADYGAVGGAKWGFVGLTTTYLSTDLLAATPPGWVSPTDNGKYISAGGVGGAGPGGGSPHNTSISTVNSTTDVTLAAATLTNPGLGIRAIVTMTIASPCQVTDAAHGLYVGEVIAFTTTGALPTGLTAGTTYYVKTIIDPNTYTVAATLGGAAINTSGSQSGVHTRIAPQYHIVAWGPTNEGVFGFQGSITGNVLTIFSIDVGCVVKVGSPVTWTNIPPGVSITGFGSGTGGVGTYTVTATPNVGAQNMASGGAFAAFAAAFQGQTVTLTIPNDTFVVTGSNAIFDGISNLTVVGTTGATIAGGTLGYGTSVQFADNLHQARAVTCTAGQPYIDLVPQPEATITNVVSASATVTFTIANPCVVTDVGHGFSVGQPIAFVSGGALPTGVSQFFTNYVQSIIDADHYTIAAANRGTTFVTMTIASPCVVNDVNHGFLAGKILFFSTTGALPTGITAITSYYVKTVIDANNYTISATNGGAVVNTSGSQSGYQLRGVVIDTLNPTTPVTMTIASPCQVTDTANGFVTGQVVVFSTTGALPTGLVAGTSYFVKTIVDPNTYTVSATNGGAAINTSGSQSGAHGRTADNQSGTQTRRSPAVITVNSTAGFTSDSFTCIYGVGGCTEINSGTQQYTVLNGTQIVLKPDNWHINFSWIFAFSAYTSGGTLGNVLFPFTTGPCMMGMDDLQGGGYPTNAQVKEYVDITAIDSNPVSPTYRRLSLLNPLKFSYSSRPPAYNVGGAQAGAPDYGGPATLYVMPASWNATFKYQNIILAQDAEANSGVRHQTFDTVTMHGAWGSFPSMCQSWSMINCVGVDDNPSPGSGIDMEADKLTETLTINGSSLSGIAFQSAGFNDLMMDGTTVAFSIVGSVINTTIKNSSIGSGGGGIGVFIPGPTYGRPEKLTVETSTIYQFGNTQNLSHSAGNFIYTLSFLVNNGLQNDITMVNGLMTISNTLAGGYGGLVPTQWAAVGTHLFLYDGNIGIVGMMTITDVWRDQFNTYIQTDWKKSNGGWPARSYLSPGLQLVVHPAPYCSFTNVVGCPEVIDLSGAPKGDPLFTYTNRSYNGSVPVGGTVGGGVVNSPYWPLWGKLKKFVIRVPNEYIGPTSAVTMHVAQSYVADDDPATNVTFVPTINMKQPGTRTFDFNTLTWLNGQPGDILPTLTRQVYSASSMRMVMDDISAQSPSYGGLHFSIEMQTDQGFSNAPASIAQPATRGIYVLP